MLEDVEALLVDYLSSGRKLLEVDTGGLLGFVEETKNHWD